MLDQGGFKPTMYTSNGPSRNDLGCWLVHLLGLGELGMEPRRLGVVTRAPGIYRLRQHERIATEAKTR